MYGWLMHGRNLHVRELRSSYAHVRVGTHWPEIAGFAQVLPGSPHEKSPNHCFGFWTRCTIDCWGPNWHSDLSPSKKKVVRAQRITSLEGYMASNLSACAMVLVRCVRYAVTYRYPYCTKRLRKTYQYNHVWKLRFPCAYSTIKCVNRGPLLPARKVSTGTSTVAKWRAWLC